MYTITYSTVTQRGKQTLLYVNHTGIYADVYLDSEEGGDADPVKMRVQISHVRNNCDGTADYHAWIIMLEGRKGLWLGLEQGLTDVLHDCRDDLLRKHDDEITQLQSVIRTHEPSEPTLDAAQTREALRSVLDKYDNVLGIVADKADMGGRISGDEDDFADCVVLLRHLSGSGEATYCHIFGELIARGVCLRDCERTMQVRYAR